MSEVSENAAVRGEGGPDVAAPGDRSGTLRAEVDDSCDPKVAQIPRSRSRRDSPGRARPLDQALLAGVLLTAVR